MTRQELVDRLLEQSEVPLSRASLSRLVDLIFQEIGEALGGRRPVQTFLASEPSPWWCETPVLASTPGRERRSRSPSRSPSVSSPRRDCGTSSTGSEQEGPAKPRRTWWGRLASRGRQVIVLSIPPQHENLTPSKPQVLLGSIVSLLPKPQVLLGSIISLLPKPQVLLGSIISLLPKPQVLLGSIISLLPKPQVLPGSIISLLPKPQDHPTE